MSSRSITSSGAVALLLLIGRCAVAHDPPPGGCGAFTGDVAHELAVMRAVAIPVNAVAGAANPPPELTLDKHYAISLIAQNHLRLRVKPARDARGGASRAGVFQFEVPESGRYRVSITSRHWIDIVDGETVLSSADHHGPGCDLVHKIVEFDLTSGRPLTLQLSGQDDAIVGLAITASPSAPAQGKK
ncbi:MAG TPA: hypothetical protein VGO61_01545 [Steroidobacteraceae bacterium]|jgi:hypothetical protein|nr:hypothetical protein [Steroidobacteraceae bacterium]